MTTNQLITKIGRQRVLTALSNVVCSSSGGAEITQSITDGDTTHSPSGDAVFDALALKQNANLDIYNVKDYGAVGDGVTDDTDEIIAAIAAIPTAGGVLYFPHGDYLVTNVLTITKNIIVRGVGAKAYKFYSMNETPILGGSTIKFNHATRNCFAFNRSAGVNVYPTWTIENITIQNISSTTPSAGAGIVFDGGGHFRMNSVTVDRFYIDVDVVSALFWHMTSCDILAPILYGLRIDSGGSLDSDVGGWVIDKCNILSGFITPTTAIGIYWKGSGAGMIVNTNFNAQTELTPSYSFVNCIVIDFSGGASSDVIISTTTFENFQQRAIYMTNGSGGFPGNVILSDLEIAPVSTPSQSAIEVNDYDRVIINGVNATNYGTAIAQPMLKLTAIDKLSVNNILSTDYTTPYTLTSVTNFNVNPISANVNNVLYGTLGLQNIANFNSFIQDNSYFDGAAFKYINNGFANVMQLNGTLGNTYFYTAASGSAGGTVSYLQRLIINNAGYVGFGGNASTVGEARFYELTGNGSNYRGFKVPSAVAADIAYEIPPAPTVTGQVLTSTTAGVMSWAAAAIDANAGDAATINALAGRFRKDTSGSTFTLTNSFISANSIIILTIATTGITAGFDLAVVAGSGSAVITFQTAGVAAAPNANCDVNFIVMN